MAGLGLELSKIAVGKSTIAPEPKDWRFANPAWKENPAFRPSRPELPGLVKTTLDLVDDAQFDWRTGERARWPPPADRRPWPPPIVLPLNPDAVDRAYETGGAQLVRA